MSTTELIAATHQILSEIKTQFSYDRYGWASLLKPYSISQYESWVNEGYHGEMKYLENHLPFKKDPLKFSIKENQHFRSALVFTFPYKPHPQGPPPFKSLKIASYVGGKDYHLWIQSELAQISSHLSQLFPTALFLPATDSLPVLERDLAARAGLGWIGKNSCLIENESGSFFLIGEILTDLEFPDLAAEFHDFCGTCSRCITACPTQAILNNRTLDARKCISYLTIESQNSPPAELRKALGDHFFGCDICQDVCPWNIKFNKKQGFSGEIKIAPHLKEIEEELRLILSSSGKKLMAHLKDSPLSRARPFGLKRNAILNVAHFRLVNLRELVASYQQDPKLGELSKWCLEQLR